MPTTLSTKREREKERGRERERERERESEGEREGGRGRVDQHMQGASIANEFQPLVVSALRRKLIRRFTSPEVRPSA
jgi:hypothetical protein